MKRSLSLKRESLSDLSGDDLGNVGGGQLLTHLSCGTCGTYEYSLRECRTLPVYQCFSLYAGCSTFCTE